MTRPRKTSARWLISIKGVVIQLFRAQWEAMLLLGPAWTFLKAGAIRVPTQKALEKRGWVEFKRGDGWLGARLTREGLMIRDLIHIREAERWNKALYDDRGRLRKVPLDRQTAIPTTRPRS